MFRVIYYYGGGYHYRSWVETREEAKLEALTCPNPPLGLALVWEDQDNAPSSWGYYLVDNDKLLGVSKSRFFDSVGVAQSG